MPLNIELQEERYVELLGKLIADAKETQNNPPDQVPREQLVVDHVLEFLGPDLKVNGGVLEHKVCTYVDGRPNLIVTYPGTGDKVVSFVGMHMDVVTADDSTWKFPAFEMTREGDQLRGRGVTDCLGHVALVADLLKSLCEAKATLKRSVVAVFIANEEKSDVLGVGVDELVKHGELKHLINGPLLWIDSADSMPCAGTAGTTTWTLKAKGKMGHSGLPHNAVNPIILANEALNKIMERFHKDFPAHENEKRYNFRVPSTMKPTQVFYPLGSQNQIPAECTIAGDIRLIPFYNTADVLAAVQSYVDDINKDIESLPTRGPVNSYVLPDGTRGSVEITFGNSIDGVAVNMDNAGFKALSAATTEVIGKCEHYSITGSLPLIDTLQSEGFDVNIVGYGKADAYHADNEYAELADLRNGTKILVRFIEMIEEQE